MSWCAAIFAVFALVACASGVGDADGNARVQLEVSEGQPKGTVVGRIPVKAGFTYRFNEPSNEFALNGTTGEITTAQILDRESLSDDRYDLIVLSSQPTYPIEVRVVVTDVNDNAPEFPEPVISVSFPESAAPDNRVLLDTATDRDTGTNGVSSDYRIVAGNVDDKFRLHVTTSPGGDSTYLYLQTAGKLDREMVPFYQLNVSVRDGGVPTRYGYQAVNVTILDVNDNPPVFAHADYTAWLNESAPPGTFVLQVTALDADLGDNGRVTYYLPEEADTGFRVDADTGAIYTTEEPNCPQQNCPNVPQQQQPSPRASCPKSCVFTVYARDHGSPRQIGRAYVTISLIDANDHDPVVRFRYFPSNAAYATVDENAANGSVVAAVSVVDPDEGANGETTVEIVSGNEMNHFRLESSQSFYIVRVNGVLDREQINKYNLTVLAIDGGTPARTTLAHLLIHVNDINDHEPVFEKSEYSVTLSELSPIGTYVASITATDEDTGINAQIYYSIVSGNAFGWFDIDSDTGLVTLKGRLDREQMGTAEIRISARDGGPNPKWAYTQLKVIVLDENDESPDFTQKLIEVKMLENIPENTLVAMLTASDHDQGTNGSVSYSLHPEVQYKYKGAFALDSLTGQLTVKTRLDRENTQQYKIKILAKDQGSPPKSSTATVILDVLDVNDNDPVFLPQQYVAFIGDNHPTGTNILTVSAYDIDEGDNAIVEYRLTGGGDSGLFYIDAHDGSIRMKSGGDLLKSVYRLNVTAVDRDGREAAENAYVEIIRNPDETLKFDTVEGYTFQIYEDHGGQEDPVSRRQVGRIKVKEIKSDVAYFVLYGNDGNFKVDRNGILTTSKKIDREKQAFYSIRVGARVGSKFGTTVVNVTVLDVNDNEPTFVTVIDEVDLYEDTAVGQELCVARAKDKDVGLNGRVTYRLVSEPDTVFRISESSGIVYLHKPIYASPGTVINTEIVATDSGNPPLSAKHVVLFTVRDVNDHTPVFDHTSYESSLSEATAVNTRFFGLNAMDRDYGSNAKLSYAIEEGDANENFGIFPDGMLYIRRRLDRENRDYYALSVVVRDGGVPARSSSVVAVVHVTDENDNRPEFANATFDFHVNENEPAGTFVGKLSASDRDVGRNAELTYALVDFKTDFWIDPKNGFVRTQREFDREQLIRATGRNMIVLEATVSDNGKRPLRDKARVNVYINDVNDNRPRFFRQPYRVQVSEGSPVGTHVLRVYATDEDDGQNGAVHYALEDGADGKFGIDSSTGAITIDVPLDRESRASYVLRVTARDSASPATVQLNATTMVVVEVLDDNDNAPRFELPPVGVSVFENATVDSELVRFHASDPDLGANGAVRYAIVSGNRRDTFRVDGVTGALYLHKRLDFEDVNSYALNVSAYDGGNPRLSSSVPFHVTVLDCNDNPPQFPSTAIVRQITENIAPGTVVVHVVADDSDSGANGRVHYSIARQEPDDDRRCFRIDEMTGVISTVLAIDRERVDAYRLTVTAVDQAMPPETRLSAEKTVTVIVDDENDNAPVFVSMDTAVVHGRHVGAHLMRVAARDLDAGTNGLVTYEMVGGDAELFAIDRVTGAIALRRELTRPERSYRLTVRATDEAVQSERKSTDAYVTLLTARDGVEPQGTSAEYEGSVYENEPPGTSVLRFDPPSPGPVEYYVVNVTGSDGRQADRMFAVDVKLGVLYTAATLDREGGADRYVVHVYATNVGSQTPKTGHIQVKVKVLDRNDNRPTWPGAPIEYKISEEIPIGSLAATLKATDLDLDSTLTYEVVEDDDNTDDHDSPFVVDTHTGNVRVRRPVDRETNPRIVLPVRVSDGVHSSVTSVVFIVVDSNDNAPAFTKSVYSLDVSEGTSRGTKIGDILAVDEDEGANGAVAYSVISDWANDVFNIDPHTGAFSLTGKLDYEQVQHYIMIVQAQDAGKPMLSSTVTVYINVIDENDNAPVFETNSYNVDVYENATVNTVVATATATDRDSGINGNIKYSIQSIDQEDNDFTIDPDNGTIWPHRNLDRETRASYNLIVTAKDGGRPVASVLSSTVQMTITIKDVNDCSPRWITSNTTEVMENVEIGTIVTVLKAVDNDEEKNGFVEYWMINSGDEKTFTIGSVDGVLRVASFLDRETRSFYQLEIGAKDRGDPSLSSIIKLTVNVLDENDNSPVFDPRHYTSSVPENVTIGYTVVQLFATDKDFGSNAGIRYTITNGDDNLDFSIADDTGLIRVAKYLNYERKSRYVLTVKAEDSPIGVDKRVNSDEIIVVITVLDINDNYPVFPDSPYVVHVLEEYIPESKEFPVVVVEATDADSGYNGRVRYYLKDTEYFTVDSVSGKIHLVRSLDREAQSEHLINVVAMDSGTPSLSGTGFIRVIVQDVNDHSPQFQQKNYVEYVDENSPIGYSITQLTATDSDIGLNAKIKYSLLGSKQNKFEIDEDSGIIKTSSNLDREENEVYFLTVVAQDLSLTEPKASVANLTVFARDVNDNYPIFSTSQSVIYVSDKTQSGQFIFGVTATDLDSGNNGKVVYSLTTGDTDMFYIDENTGVIESSKKLTKQMEYKLKIEASDKGNVPKHAEFELTVILWPDRDFPVVRHVGTQQLSIVENSSPGSGVSRVLATSPKIGSKGVLRFSIAGGDYDNTFEVDSVSGEVVISKNGIDHEKSNQYKIWIEASDSDDPKLRSAVLLTINVTDVNDNPPVFEYPFYTISVQEETLPPTNVISVIAEDKDMGKNSVITYRLTDDINGIFNIDENSGEIVTNTKLDRETDDHYTLVVEAVDQGYPSLTGSTVVHINILDINDNPPRFTRLFSVNVTENTEVGSFVIGITSLDLDAGVNAKATYRFTENPGNMFKIDSNTGKVYVAAPLDREVQDEYLLNVVAADGSWQAETPLTITIQDVNDNAPEFDKSYYKFNFPETNKIGTTVGRIIANDKDKQGSNSVVSYNLKQPSDVFSIDPIYGDIFTKRALKYKHSTKNTSPENEYTLTVLATDNGKPPLSAECLVLINIIDSNNNAPQFEKKKYFSSIPINLEVWSPLITVIATDHDSGVNSEVEYFVYGGNATDIVQVDRFSGLVSLKTKLTDTDLSKSYDLVIRATDHGVPPKQDTTDVTFTMTSENNFSPEFSSFSYQVFVPENEPVGTTILIVKATDQDEGPNGLIRYSFESLSNKFKLNPETGAITITAILDFEHIKEYKLNIIAMDTGFEPKQSKATLSIILTDINDNPPVFNQTLFNMFLFENSPPGTFVSQMTATDLDSPKNAIINYSIIGGTGENLFYCNSTSGAIYSKQIFDYEKEKSYSLEILAINPDSSLSGSTKVIVHIQGVNEYYPTFSQSVFYYDVPESAEIGTYVGAVKATDLDSGNDGKVYYFLVGSSNDKGFTIDHNTGLLRVSRHLDRETQNRIILTVMAKNGGSIRGNDTDEAQVIISIQDGNDPPEFDQDYYECLVSEGTRPGAKILTVHAVDKDAWPQNNQFSYSILNNMSKLFRIDSQNGSIESVGHFDRETINYYEIIIGAVDTGSPPQTGSATVKVVITDVNDNGPVLASDNNVGYVSENEPINTSIMVLTATDADQPPNGAPFTYRIVGGPHREFVVLDESSGLLRTARSIDREQTPNLSIVISITDNGSPQITTENLLNVVILDQNDCPSSPRSVRVLVFSLKNEFPVGKIADVRPIDPDTTGDYKCYLEKSSKDFLIPESCDLHINSISKPVTVLHVSGNDGKHDSVTNVVTVEYQIIDKNIIENTIFTRIEKVTSTDFMENHYTKFMSVMNTTFEDNSPLLYSVNEVEGGIDVAIAVRGLTKEHVNDALKNKLNHIAQTTKLMIFFDYSPCQKNTCENDGNCSTTLTVSRETYVTNTQDFIFTSPTIVQDFVCTCAEGYAGKHCDKRQDPCAPNPCQYGGTCRRQGISFQCFCPSDREGLECEKERYDKCDNNPCMNGGSCRQTQDIIGYFCLCRPGYRGNICELSADSCRPNPCLNGGSCVSLKPGYKCNCPNGLHGRHCDKSSFGFNEYSYMAFPSLDSITNDITLVFSTSKPDALLLYNYGTQIGGRSDFISIELIEGKCVFSYGGARSSITSISVGKNDGSSLADSQWYKISAVRNGKVLSLSVSSCIDNGDNCQECRPSDKSCYRDNTGTVGTLNFNGNNLLIGGVISADPLLERLGQVHSDDFVGCMHSVTINGYSLNLSSPISSKAVDPFCNRQGQCAQPSTLCGEGSTCLDRWSGVMCKCEENDVLSPNCFQAFKPVSLGEGAFLEYKITEKHRRMHLLESIYKGTTIWRHQSRERRSSFITTPNKELSLMFRTMKSNATILLAASNSDFTLVKIANGKLSYTSFLSTSTSTVNMSVDKNLDDGNWHNLTMVIGSKSLKLFLNRQRVGEELDSASVHDFLDPYLTKMYLGGVDRDYFPGKIDTSSFSGCLANLTVNRELQPFNGTGSIFPDVLRAGPVSFDGCDLLSGLAAVGTAATDPLGLGVALVIAFFIVLLMAITVSFVAFKIRRLRANKADRKEADGGAGKDRFPGGMRSHPASGPVLDSVPVSQFACDPGDAVRHRVMQAPPELLASKRQYGGGDHRYEDAVAAATRRPHRPDIIDREVVGKSSPPPPHCRDELVSRRVSSSGGLGHRHDGCAADPHDAAEHYDLENASSIAPSDIDIVYHYKSYRDGNNLRKMKSHLQGPGLPAAMYHKQMRHATGFQPPHSRDSRTTAPPPPPPLDSASHMKHQSTPLARLSPSSELSQQLPRILTLRDISGKPLQTALLASSSSGTASKDCPMHSNSERSLSEVMSGHSLSGSGLSGVGVGSADSGGRSQSEQHMQLKQQLHDLVKAAETDHHHHQQQLQQEQRRRGKDDGGDDVDEDDDTGSSTSSDESGNDSFTCSEIEYDNNSVSGEKLSDVIFNKTGGGGKSASGSSSAADKDSQRRRRRLPLPSSPPPPPLSPAQRQQHQNHRRREQEQAVAAAGYDTFDSSFRGSLSTLVASDDDGPTMYHRGNARTPNNASESSSIPVGLGWDYLLNWAPPPPSPPRYDDRDLQATGYRNHRQQQQQQQQQLHHRRSVTPRAGDGSSRSSSRQSPCKSPEEYV